MAAKAGDKVKITTKDGTFEGTLLPRPKMLSQNIRVLKLETGYNIGISNKKIKKTTITEKYKPAKPKPKSSKKDPKLPTVAILSCGGTISSRIDYRTGGVIADYTAEDFVAMCPELKQIANIKSKKVMSKMSESMQPEDWQALAKQTVKELDKADGIVITHGTDTMHYTAAAMSFLLKDLGKPVIITGSQRSIDRGSSDAFMNLACAVTAAAKWGGAEVAICMHASMNDDYCHLIRGTKVRKMHTTRRDAFRAINDEPLAEVYPDGRVEELSEFKKRNENKTSLRKLSAKARLIHIYPGMEPKVVEERLKGAKGAIIAGTALGHIPVGDNRNLEAVFKRKSKKMPLFVCSQTIYGRVHPYVYANLRKVSMGIGAKYLDDILPETALAKLMVALTEKDTEEFMQKNIAGEFTDRELDDAFLQ